jgi:ABC-type branched-subunit amino acid transport system substrate-binding protein
MLLKRAGFLILSIITAMFLMAGTSSAAQGEEGKIPEGPIKIGFAVPLSGVLVLQDPGAGEASKLAAEYVNKYEGGILGRMIQPITYDTKADPATAVNVYGKLIEDDHVEAVLGNNSSGTGIAVAPKVENKWHVPTILLESTTMAMFTKVVPKPKYVFRVGPDDLMQSVTHVVAVLKANPNVETIAIGGPDYEWGHDVVERFKEVMEAFKPGVKFVYTFFPPFAQAGPNFTPFITTIMQNHPDVYVGYMLGSDLVAWHNQAEAVGLYKKIPLAMDVMGFVSEVEGNLAEARGGGGIFPPWALGYPNAKYTPMLLNKIGAYPNFGMDIHMLEGLLFLKKAYEKAYALSGRYPTPEMVATAMDGLAIIGPCGVTSMIDHQSTAPGESVGRLYKTEDGKWSYKDMVFVPDYLKIVPPGMTFDQFIKTLGELRKTGQLKF